MVTFTGKGERPRMGGPCHISRPHNSQANIQNVTITSSNDVTTINVGLVARLFLLVQIANIGLFFG
jgi:hypothetical protein